MTNQEWLMTLSVDDLAEAISNRCKYCAYFRKGGCPDVVVVKQSLLIWKYRLKRRLNGERLRGEYMTTTVGALRRSIEGLPDNTKLVVLYEGCFCNSPQIHVDNTKKTKQILVIDCEDTQTFFEIEG